MSESKRSSASSLNNKVWVSSTSIFTDKLKTEMKKKVKKKKANLLDLDKSMTMNDNLSV